MFNRISKWFFTGIMAAVLLPSAYAAAGSEGHGGSAMVCRDAGGTITSAFLLDLVEAEQEYGLTVTRKNEAINDQITVAISRILPNYSLYQKVQQAVQTVQANLRFVSTNFGLTPVDDSYPVIQPKNGCQFEQLAVYDASGNILVNTEIYNSLNPTDQAALVVHEAVYKLDRDMRGTTNSIHARKGVAYLFGNSTSDQLTAVMATFHPVPKLGPWSNISDCGNGALISIDEAKGQFVVNYTFGTYSPNYVQVPGSCTKQVPITFQCDATWSDCVASPQTINLLRPAGYDSFKFSLGWATVVNATQLMIFDDGAINGKTSNWIAPN